MAQKPFTPTDAQKQTVVMLKAVNTREEYIMRVIINPDTEKPVAKETFEKAFEYELKHAKALVNERCTAVVYAGLDANKYISTKDGGVVEVPDLEMRLKCARTIQQLCSKGVYEPKFVVPKDATPIQELDATTEALREGKINSYEADSLIGASKAKIDASKEVERNTGINVTIDAKTADLYSGVIKDVIKDLTDDK